VIITEHWLQTALAAWRDSGLSKTDTDSTFMRKVFQIPVGSEFTTTTVG